MIGFVISGVECLGSVYKRFGYLHQVSFILRLNYPDWNNTACGKYGHVDIFNLETNFVGSFCIIVNIDTNVGSYCLLAAEVCILKMCQYWLPVL
jgi:hypothetical protein